MGSLSKACYLLGGSFTGLVLWQHIGRNGNFLKPSDIIGHAILNLDQLFTYIGNKFACLSSFYEKLKLNELGRSIYEVIQPLSQLTVTPITSFARGYYLYIRDSSLLKSGYTIYLGSITLIIVISYLGKYLTCRYFPGVAATLAQKYSSTVDYLRSLFAYIVWLVEI